MDKIRTPTSIKLEELFKMELIVESCEDYKTIQKTP